MIHQIIISVTPTSDGQVNVTVEGIPATRYLTPDAWGTYRWGEEGFPEVLVYFNDGQHAVPAIFRQLQLA